ncbi:FtsW/RodA/SpoVE family cell cycle protein [Neosynechococcus sphagnicola]|uniref:FtsW/RodA/SpoVE family cell cycle protein n=1 Tax=Neosynechococcus sphagnicola TaxID=1501145 RepID=UPI00056329F8|nr:FtsW/RodA/SpoVE family cell cycle protein [Neosynechococcus sphagnicola]
MNLRYLIPFFDSSIQEWALEARLLRWLTFLWLLVGVVILFSASYAIADVGYGDGLYYVKRQLIWIGIGLVGFQLLVNFPLRYILRLTPAAILLLLGLILATYLPGIGQTVNGATRWISLGPFPLQPSELIKPFLVLQAASLFGQWYRLTWTTRFAWLGVFGLILLGILLQPNLSTTALCGITLWLIALAGGLPYSYLATTGMGGLMLGTLSITFREYQRRRVMSFLNPWADPAQDGYQLIQSLLAVGSGGAWGTGFGLSQQKLFYLPIQYTDFIFAVFAEEFGFMGCLLLFSLLAVYGTLSIWVAQKAEQPVYRLVAIGAMLLLVGQSLLNIGVATGALPTTGLPFPFLSYGGSSMIASLLVAGLLIRVARETSHAEIVPLNQPRPPSRPRRFSPRTPSIQRP